MSDARLTLMLEGVAAADLEGVILADVYAETRPRHCAVAAAGIMKKPDPASEQMDQLIFGEAFDVLTELAGFAFGQARRDGYVGWVALGALAPGTLRPSHWVSARQTLVFTRPDLKSAVRMILSMNSLVRAAGTEGRFTRIGEDAWIFEGHLSPIGLYETDPVAVAARFAGAPYLWGGRTGWGADCSGLVQQARYACGQSGERDSDMQAELGTEVSAKGLKRGDLIFWKGHVGYMTDAHHLLHANAHHMATETEVLAGAIERIDHAGGGRPTAYRRP